jgi:hypothetical protein
MTARFGKPGRRSARVRPYALTGGRTRTRRPLLVETLVTSIGRDGRLERTLRPESWAIYELCAARRSIAEIAAVLGLPLGVVRVLVSDLADAGQMRIHPAADSIPRRELLERVLHGLQSA